MAVFTAVTKQDLTLWLRHYSLGSVVSFQGIESGIENSNFFLTTTQGEYVLTLFERLSANELPFYLRLMQHLAAHRIPVPEPVARNDGALLGELNGKPAAIVTKLRGAVQWQPQAQHCAQVGRMLARAHLAGRGFALQQTNLRSLDWWREVTPALEPFLTKPQRDLLIDELAFQQAFFTSSEYARLPAGPCHCDLFRDNVLFVSASCADENDRLSGVFDFYFAGCDKWLFDLAVCVNDWCANALNGQLDAARTYALLRAYQSVRPFIPTEALHWRAMLRAGALRFWISRLYDDYLPRQASMLQPHDPAHFERILRDRIDNSTLPWF